MAGGIQWEIARWLVGGSVSGLIEESPRFGNDMVEV